MQKADIDVKECTRLYIDEQMPSTRLGEIFKVNHCTIIRTLKRAGAKIRHHNDTKRGRSALNKIYICPKKTTELYLEPGATANSVAAELGVYVGVVRRTLREAGVPRKGRFAEYSARWRADLTKEEREKRRDLWKQSVWRKKVYERDNFTCQKCGDARGANLNAHHIEPHCLNKEKRWDVSNGVTLCVACHRSFHKRFGLRNFGIAELLAHKPGLDSKGIS